MGDGQHSAEDGQDQKDKALETDRRRKALRDFLISSIIGVEQFVSNCRHFFLIPETSVIDKLPYFSDNPLVQPQANENVEYGTAAAFEVGYDTDGMVTASSLDASFDPLQHGSEYNDQEDEHMRQGSFLEAMNTIINDNVGTGQQSGAQGSHSQGSFQTPAPTATMLPGDTSRKRRKTAINNSSEAVAKHMELQAAATNNLAAIEREKLEVQKQALVIQKEMSDKFTDTLERLGNGLIGALNALAHSASRSPPAQ